MRQVSAKSKVFVGLSGGVDSSVSAALLKQATPNNFSKLFGRPTPKGFRGYDVTGVFIKVWQPDFIECTWKEDRLDAMRVCAKLGIPFITLDLSKEYKKEVVDYMIAEYKAGRTPNPDVMCNRHVKLGGFYQFARENGADCVATGHYARVCEITNHKLQITNKSQIQNSKLQTINYELLTGLDTNKDQSYFLWTLNQEQLAHTLFPVGHLEKPKVRKLAKKFGLPTADKKDSQGLCFLGKIDVKQFLKNFIKPKRGKVLDKKGEIIGEHDGAMFFTLGERHGFKVTSKTSNDKPYYVIEKDIEKNTLTVSQNPHEKHDGTSRKIFALKDVNWISGLLAKDRPILARIRYRQPLQKVRIENHESRITIKFEESQTGGAAGQSIVFYEDEVCLGGGVIK